MNRPVIIVMYGIAGLVSGYFSTYFLIEMKREYGDKFTRPRNRVSRKIKIILNGSLRYLLF